MTLQTQQPTSENAPAVLTDEQRRRVADALESAQSENTRKNYESQFGKFRTWCEQEVFSSLPAQPEVLAAYVAELAEDGKSMSTIRLAVAAIVDAHSNCVESQEEWPVTFRVRSHQGERCLSMELRITSSFRIQAVRATFFGLPAANSRW